MIDMVACLIPHETDSFSTDIVNKVHAWKLQVYESATCHSKGKVGNDRILSIFVHANGIADVFQVCVSLSVCQR